MLPDDRIKVVADWPNHETIEGQVQAADATALLAFYVNDGQVLPLIQQALAVSGKLKGQERVSEHILGRLNHLLRDGSPEASQDEPGYVHPEEVFSSRKEEE